MISDAFNKLPIGWTYASVGELIPFSYGKGLTKRERDGTGCIPVYGSSGVVGVHTDALVDHPTIVVGRKGSVGAVYICRTSSYPIDTVFFSGNFKDLHLDFVAYQLRFLQLARLDNSTTIPSLSRDNLHKVRLVIAPHLEQARIVEAIEAQFTRLDSGVAALKRVEANLKRYKASVLKAACEGKLIGAKSGRRFFDKENWKPIDLGIATMQQGWSPRCDRIPASQSEWGVIKTSAVQSFHFNGDKNKRLPDSLKPRPALELLKGDLLITRAGPRARAGVSCLVRNTRSKLIVCDKVYRIRCRSDVVSSSYLELILNSPQIKNTLNDLMTGISDSGVNLTQKRFRDVLIPIPPISIQRKVEAEFFRQLSLLDESRKLVEQASKRCDRLRQSILKQAFEGKLVEQDPTDEPASILLERIRDSRNGNGPRNSQSDRPKPKRRKNSRKSA